MTPSACNSVPISVSGTCIINVDGKKKKKCFLTKIHKSALGQRDLGSFSKKLKPEGWVSR